MLRWRVGHAIRIHASRCVCDNTKILLGDDIKPVLVGRRRKYLIERRNREDPVNTRNVLDVGDNAVGAKIEGGDDPRPKMRDEQQPVLRVDGLVVKPVGLAGQGNVGMRDLQQQ